MKVLVRSIELRLLITVDALTPPSLVRAAIVVDRQTNGVLATHAEVWDTIAPPGNAVCQRNLANRRRFKIIFDHSFPVMSELPVKNYHLYMKLRRPIVEEFNAGVAGTIADISSSSIVLFLWSSDNGGINLAQATTESRIRYTDM